MFQLITTISFLMPLFTTTNAAPPNIIFMLIDDLGWNDIGWHNGSDFPTPNIDKLATNGLELNNYYIQHICSPTRSSLMSGRYPIHTGLQHAIISGASPYGLPLDLTIIPQDLKRVGYETHMLGKWHIGFCAPEYTPTYRGFDTYFGYYLGAEDYYYHNASEDGDRGYDFRNQTNPIMFNGDYSTWLYGNETMRLLKDYDENSTNQNPFFIYLPFQAVHFPLEAPQYIVETFRQTIDFPPRRKYAAMTTVLDDVIGQIVNFLQNDSKKNLWDNLMLIFSSDNGAPVRNQTTASNFPLRGGKATLYDGGVKGAGFISGGWLNDNRRGKQMNALMHITDWYPTFCDIIGIEPTNKSILDGYSQLDNIQNGETDIYAPRSEILHNIDPINCPIKQFDICGGIRMKNWKLVIGSEVTMPSPGWYPLDDVNQNYTTIQCSNNDGNYNYPPLQNNECPFNGKACLFDIVNDPCEYYDESQNESAIYKQLYDRLLYYNSTMVTPLQLLYPVNSTAANPDNFGGFWSPWINITNFTNNKHEL
eukprot:6916_1